MQGPGTSMLRCGALLIALAAAGCGQKGPLYHPDAKPQPAPAPPTAPAPAPSSPGRRSGDALIAR